MVVPKAQYNIKEEKDHIIYTRKYGGITVNNKFPRVAQDTEKRMDALRYLAARMIMEKLEE